MLIDNSLPVTPKMPEDTKNIKNPPLTVRPDYPRVYVEITNICNLHCSFCHGHSRSPGRMSREDFSRVLDRLAGHTRYLCYHLMGEPLTHPELPGFLEMAADRGFRSVITTNGTLLKKRGAELIRAKPHKVSISLHSFEEEDPQAFARYLAETADFADSASRAGIITVFRLWNRGFDDGRNQTALDFLHARLEGPWAENTRGYRIRDRLFLEWGDRFQWPDRDAPEQGSDVFCYGLRDHFGILCDGSVVPCCLDSDGVITLGNLFEKPLEEILDSPRAKEMLRGFACRTATEDLCRRCGYARRFG